MKILLGIFLGLAAVIWLSSFGYILFLSLLARFRKSTTTQSVESPRIAVVIPTLNEEQWIDRKLDNLRALDYPADRIRVVVVDGGSEDGTLGRVRDRILRGEAIELISLAGGSGKAAQLNRVFADLDEAVVVVTDADTTLEPSCVGFLAGRLEAEPQTGIVSAMVDPQTDLIEEKVHWSFLNWIWWLEGEVWSSPGMSGVCYAMRRAAFSNLMECAEAEDVHLALDAAARGYRVRMCRQALVREMRVPQTLLDYLRFRHQRGGRYLTELSRSYPGNPGLQGWKIAQRIRQLQMTWVPRMAMLVGILAAGLIASPHWPWVLGAAAWFALFSLLLMAGARRFANHREQIGLVRWSWAGIGCAFLTLISLLLLDTPFFAGGSSHGGR